MVKEFFIDCEKLRDFKEVHRYLAETLEFPKYYGNNLNALFDCLTEKDECTILFKGAIKLYKEGGYGAEILKVMRDAAVANPMLKMVMIEDETVPQEEDL